MTDTRCIQANDKWSLCWNQIVRWLRRDIIKMIILCTVWEIIFQNEQKIFMSGPRVNYVGPQDTRLGPWLIIPPASTKLKEGYTGITLSVCPFVDRIVSALYLQQYSSDPYLHILSNFRRCVACNARFEIQKFEILANFLNLQLWLCLLLTWDPIWLNGMGNHEATGGILRTQAF